MIDLIDMSMEAVEPPPVRFPAGSFPEVIDNSIRSNFVACEAKFHYGFVRNISPAGTNVHLHAGGAFAHGIEATRRAFYIDGASADDAIAKGISELLLFYGDYECPPESAKSAERMAGALEFYFERYKLDTDYLRPAVLGGETGIEFSFSIPLPIAHPQTGNPILYSGRFDMLAEDQRSGSLFVVDEKTATQLGASWAKQWELDSQFTGYCWGAREYGKPVAGAIIRGVSILKTKYDSIECPVVRSNHLIDRWYRQLLKDVQRMIEIWRTNDPSYQLDKGSCGSYGGCSFQLLCGTPDAERWIPVQFEPRVWHPMLREEREAEIALIKGGRL
ncbi:MAG: PD-(D/E)XK nuclease family protein [Bdellovibrio sp.]